jgi:hypothetical protein
LWKARDEDVRFLRIEHAIKAFPTVLGAKRMIGASWQSAVVAIVSLSSLSHLAFAQEAPGRPAGTTEKPASARAEYIELLKVLPLGVDQPLAPTDRPLFSYSDSARIIAEGAIWAWGSTGRPLVMAKAWKNANGTRTCAFSLTSDELVIVRGPQSKTWRPEKTQVEAADLAGAPAPDPQNAVRLRQLKEQARRFTAYEYWNSDNSRFELRLLIQPVHRYQDEKRQIIDGAVFLLAYDNNPQILLFVEILSPAASKMRWQYLLARVSSADLHVCLDGNEVWAQDRTPGIVGKPTDYYWHMVTVPELR